MEAVVGGFEVDGSIVEDASWLRKKSDYSHINVEELEAVARGSTYSNCVGV